MCGRRTPQTRRVRTAFLTILVAAAGCSDTSQPTEPFPFEPAQVRSANPDVFTVYTQNVYLGGNTGPVFSIDFNDIPALIAAVNTFWAEVQLSDVPERVTTFVDELDARRPHLVGLQEVFQFVEIELATGTPTVVGAIDLLASIEAEIAARALPYEVVAVQANTSTGTSFGLPLSPTRILQFTDRVVALRRTDVAVSGSDQGNYGASFMVGPLTVSRGWIRLTTEHDGVPHHFVTTHLEVQAFAPIQVAQTAELLNVVVAGLNGVTIIAGDLNSDAANPSGPSGTPTYGDIIAAGFTDAWKRGRRSRGNPGFTCCQDPDLRNPRSLLDQRIDFVLARRSGGASKSDRARGRLRAEIIGEEQGDRTPTLGLWPSDHAGLVATLRLIGDKSDKSGRSEKSRRSTK